MDPLNMVESNFIGNTLSPYDFAIKISRENPDKYTLIHYEEVASIEDLLMVSAYFYHRNNSDELIRTIEEITSDKIGFLFFDDDNRLNSITGDNSSPCFDIINMDEKLMHEIAEMADFSERYTRRNRKKGTTTFKV